MTTDPKSAVTPMADDRKFKARTEKYGVAEYVLAVEYAELELEFYKANKRHADAESELSRCQEELEEYKKQRPVAWSAMSPLERAAYNSGVIWTESRLAAHAECDAVGVAQAMKEAYAAPSAASGLAYPYSAAGVADRLETHLREASFNDDGTQKFNTATAATMREAVILLRAHQAPVGEGRLVEFLHARSMHPDYEYATTEGERKNFDEHPPAGEGWERNVHIGDKGWERFNYHEEAYWMRRKPLPPAPEKP